MESFDVGLVREYSERQRRDAERIVALCDALNATAEERDKLRAELAKLAPAAAPAAPGAAP